MKRNSFLAVAACSVLLVFGACGSDSDDDTGAGGETDAGQTNIPGSGGSQGGGAGTSGGNAGQSGGGAGTNGGNAGQNGGGAGQNGGNAGQNGGNAGQNGQAGRGGNGGQAGNGGSSGRADGGVPPAGTCKEGAACTEDCIQACTTGSGQAGRQTFDCPRQSGGGRRDAGAAARVLEEGGRCVATPTPRTDAGATGGGRDDGGRGGNNRDGGGGLGGLEACPAGTAAGGACMANTACRLNADDICFCANGTLRCQ